jgi:hypothetical protein
LTLFSAFLLASHAGQIHIQDQPSGAVGMSSRLTVLLEEDAEHLLHLLHILGSRRIERLLGY